MDTDSENGASANCEALCLNCASKLSGQFCAQCGQSSTTRRYSLNTIVNEVYQQFKKVDLLTTGRTFWHLTTRPGQFVREYLSGQRVGYTVPIKYFFYSFVVQIAVGGWLFWLTNDRSFDRLSHVEFSFELISLISTVFWGFLWGLFYLKSEFNIVECMVAAVFFVAQTNFFGIIVELINYIIVMANVGSDTLKSFEFLIPIGYSFYFVRKFFDDSLFWLILKQLVLNVMFVIVFIILSVVIIALSPGPH